MVRTLLGEAPREGFMRPNGCIRPVTGLINAR